MIDGPRRRKPRPPEDDTDEGGDDRRAKSLRPFGEVASGQRHPNLVYERDAEIKAGEQLLEIVRA